MAKPPVTEDPHHFVLVTFDLHDAKDSQRKRIHKAIIAEGLDKKLVKRNRETVPAPANTFSGLIPVATWPDPVELKKHLKARIKKAIRKEDLKAVLVVAVSAEYSWTVANV